MERYIFRSCCDVTDAPEVVEKMIALMTKHFGNPSSIHSYGRESRRHT